MAFRIALACVAVVGVAFFVRAIELPVGQALFLGVGIAGCAAAAVLLSRSLTQAFAGVAAMVAAAAVGAVTVCPCTGAHFLFAPPAALAAYWLALFVWPLSVRRTSRIP